ncbi:MAG: hypothetical protein KC417_01300 [Myxococcales bacterium]|nr:hypothetical protein [Myxococcales bacterium]
MSRRRHRTGSAQFEAVVLVTAVVLAGSGAYAAIGRSMANDVEGSAHGHAPHSHARSSHAPSIAAQASLVSRVSEFARSVRRTEGLTRDARAARSTAEGLVRGNDFITWRGLHTASESGGSYADKLGQAFMAQLESLGPHGHWIDMGTGEGKAVTEFLDAFGTTPGAAPDVTAIAFDDPHLNYLRATFTNFREFHGKFVESIPASDVRPADLISDLYGPLSYTHAFDTVLQRYADILRPGGKAYAYLGKSLSLRTPGAPALVRSGSELAGALDRAIHGMRVEALQAPKRQVLLAFTKTEQRVRVPSLPIESFLASKPPKRTFVLGDAVSASVH